MGLASRARVTRADHIQKWAVQRQKKKKKKRKSKSLEHQVQRTDPKSKWLNRGRMLLMLVKRPNRPKRRQTRRGTAWILRLFQRTIGRQLTTNCSLKRVLLRTQMRVVGSR